VSVSCDGQVTSDGHVVISSVSSVSSASSGHVSSDVASSSAAVATLATAD